MKSSLKLVCAALFAATILFAVAQRARAGRGRPAARATPQAAAAKPPAKTGAKPIAASAAKEAAPAANRDGPRVLTSLSSEDVALLIGELGVPQQARARLAADPEERKSFAKDLREMLALAEEARAAGRAAQPGVKIQLDLARAFVIARAYTRKCEAEGATPGQIVTEVEAAALLAEPGQAARAEEFLQDYQHNRPEAQRATPFPAEERAQLQQQWARVMVGARKGVAAGVDGERATVLMIDYQHSRLLASEYFRSVLIQRTKATKPELDAYVASHPELDASKARVKADGIFGRLRAGEDFAKLADEFTSDPSGKGRGGDSGWFGRGVMVRPFEEAAFALGPGELSGVVETQFGFHAIRVDERRRSGPGGQPAEQVHARHILIGNGRRGTQSPHDVARGAVEREKLERIIAEIGARRRVTVAEDFQADPSRLATPRP